MVQSRFFGGDVTPLLRIGFLIAASGALLVSIFHFVHYANPDFDPVSKFNWYTTVSIILTGLIGILCFVQALLPMRIIWPGWLVAAIAFVSIPTSGLLSLFGYGLLESDYEELYSSFSVGSPWRQDLLDNEIFPTIFMVGLFIALLAWQLQEPVGNRATSYFFLVNGETSRQLSIEEARDRIASGTVPSNALVSVNGSPWQSIARRKELF